MVTIDVIYRGELRCTATHGPSRSELVTDAPLDNQGKGEAFSPTDLVATAIGTCLLTTMAIAARKRGWELAGSTARVEKHMVADPKRRIAKLAVVLQIPHEFGAAERKVLEEAALTCPVHESLDARVEVPIEFRWGRS